jgi:hypothetical protein
VNVRSEKRSEKSKARVWNAGIAKIMCCLLLFFTARSKRFFSFLFSEINITMMARGTLAQLTPDGGGYFFQQWARYKWRIGRSSRLHQLAPGVARS